MKHDLVRVGTLAQSGETLRPSTKNDDGTFPEVSRMGVFITAW